MLISKEKKGLFKHEQGKKIQERLNIHKFKKKKMLVFDKFKIYKSTRV